MPSRPGRRRPAPAVEKNLRSASSGGAVRDIPHRPGGSRLNSAVGILHSAFSTRHSFPTVREYFDVFTVGDTPWITVTTLVEDPEYLTTPYVTSSNFKREMDGTAWKPRPCG